MDKGSINFFQRLAPVRGVDCMKQDEEILRLRLRWLYIHDSVCLSKLINLYTKKSELNNVQIKKKNKSIEI